MAVDPIITELAAIRRARRITQVEAATRAGLTDRAISLWETGGRGPTLAALRRYAAALGVDLALVRPDPGDVCDVCDEPHARPVETIDTRGLL